VRLTGGELERREELGELLGRLSDDALDKGERRRLIARLIAVLPSTARAAGGRVLRPGSWLAEVVADVAPHLPVRDLATLRDHHGGLSGDALAESLVASAARSTAAVGAAAGVLAAAQHAAPPTLLAAPVQVAAGTLAVVAIELKLVAELHVVHARAPVGTRGEVAAAYLGSWITRSAVDPAAPVPPLGTVLGAAARRQLRGRIARRAARNAGTLAPLLLGAVAGAELNRRETRSLAGRLLEDLRGR
jgi:hypothetical protein